MTPVVPTTAPGKETGEGDRMTSSTYSPTQVDEPVYDAIYTRAFTHMLLRRGEGESSQSSPHDDREKVLAHRGRRPWSTSCICCSMLHILVFLGPLVGVQLHCMCSP